MESIEKRVLEQIDRMETARILQELIQAPSCFPPGNTTEVANVCRSFFEKNGIECETVALKPELPSVLGSIGAGDGPTLVFHSHIDTVPVGDVSKWTHDPYSGTIANDTVYGRGAGDCKGSTAVQLAAIRAIKRAGVKLSGKLVVACVADEENCGAAGTKWLRETKQLEPDYLVIGEQTENKIGLGERQVIWVKVTVEGSASHAAIPWKGENAIVRMAYVIQEIDEWLKPRLPKGHAYLPASTVSINRISGGIKENVVPESCSISIDRRILPSENCETVFAELQEVLARAKARIGDFPSKIELIIDQGPSVNTRADDELVELFKKTTEDVTGRQSPLIGYAQGSDGRWFARDGIPIVIFGPSDPEVGHSVDECCTIDQLFNGARILALAAVRLLGTYPRLNKSKGCAILSPNFE